MILARQNPFKSVMSASKAARSRNFALLSKDRVTLNSEEERRSTEKPWFLKVVKTSAKNPTCCHIFKVSIEMRVMLCLTKIDLMGGALSSLSLVIQVPEWSGMPVYLTNMGMPANRTGGKQLGCSTLAPIEAISWASS